MPGGALVCLGQIGAPHGVRGEVRLRSFTADPAAIAAYGSLQTADGRVLKLASLRPAKDCLIAAFAGIGDRDAAAQLTNARLYVPRERLPPAAADEYYHADLIGLAAVDGDGRRRGSVVAVHNFGAGDLIEVRFDDDGRSELVPFDAHFVADVDLGAGRLVLGAAARPGEAARKAKR